VNEEDLAHWELLRQKKKIIVEYIEKSTRKRNVDIVAVEVGTLLKIVTKPK
jgi:hypothetical protein